MRRESVIRPMKLPLEDPPHAVRRLLAIGYGPAVVHEDRRTLEHEHDRAETREFTTGAVNVDVGVDREPDLDRARGRAIDPG